MVATLTERLDPARVDCDVVALARPGPVSTGLAAAGRTVHLLGEHRPRVRAARGRLRRGPTRSSTRTGSRPDVVAVTRSQARTGRERRPWVACHRGRSVDSAKARAFCRLASASRLSSTSTTPIQAAHSIFSPPRADPERCVHPQRRRTSRWPVASAWPKPRPRRSVCPASFRASVTRTCSRPRRCSRARASPFVARIRRRRPDARAARARGDPSPPRWGEFPPAIARARSAPSARRSRLPPLPLGGHARERHGGDGRRSARGGTRERNRGTGGYWRTGLLVPARHPRRWPALARAPRQTRSSRAFGGRRKGRGSSGFHPRAMVAAKQAYIRSSPEALMCGISGWVGPPDEALDRGRAGRMRDVQTRGPDGQGEWTSPAGRTRLVAGIGHRRLRIIDLTAAAPADGQRRRPDRAHLQRRDLQLPRASRELGRPGTASARAATPRSSCAPTSSGAQRRRAARRDVRARVWDARREPTAARARPHRQEAAVLRAATAAGSRSGRRSRRCSPSRGSSASSTSPGSPEFLDVRLRAASGARSTRGSAGPAGLGHVFEREALRAPRRYWDAARAEPRRADAGRCPRTSATLLATRSSAGWSPTCRSARCSPAGSTRRSWSALMSQALDASRSTRSRIGFADDPSTTSAASRGWSPTLRHRHTEFAVVDAVGLLDRLLWHHDQPFGTPRRSRPTRLPSGAASTSSSCSTATAATRSSAATTASAPLRCRAAAAPRPLARAAPRAAARVDHGYYTPRGAPQRFLELADPPVEDRYQSWIAVADDGPARRLLAPEALAAATPGAARWTSATGAPRICRRSIGSSTRTS